jgi:hypothetical protein
MKGYFGGLIKMTGLTFGSGSRSRASGLAAFDRITTADSAVTPIHMEETKFVEPQIPDTAVHTHREPINVPKEKKSQVEEKIDSITVKNETIIQPPVTAADINREPVNIPVKKIPREEQVETVTVKDKSVEEKKEIEIDLPGNETVETKYKSFNIEETILQAEPPVKGEMVEIKGPTRDREQEDVIRLPVRQQQEEPLNQHTMVFEDNIRVEVEPAPASGPNKKIPAQSPVKPVVKKGESTNEDKNPAITLQEIREWAAETPENTPAQPVPRVREQERELSLSIGTIHLTVEEPGHETRTKPPYQSPFPGSRLGRHYIR